MSFKIRSNNSIDACTLIQLFKLIEFFAEQIVNEYCFSYLRINIHTRDILTDCNIAWRDSKLSNSCTSNNKKIAFLNY